jgi:hypothetical protein
MNTPARNCECPTASLTPAPLESLFERALTAYLQARDQYRAHKAAVLQRLPLLLVVYYLYPLQATHANLIALARMPRGRL